MKFPLLTFMFLLCPINVLNLSPRFPVHQEEPKKVRFDYDLFLHLEGHPPVNHLRCEKLTFNNPTEEFRRKLLKAGGVMSMRAWRVILRRSCRIPWHENRNRLLKRTESINKAQECTLFWSFVNLEQ